MKTKLLFTAVCLHLLLALSFPAAASSEKQDAPAPETVRLMTANIWGDYFDNPVASRAPAFMEAFERYQPDILGLQECTANWHTSQLFTALDANYNIIAQFEGIEINHVPLFYKKDRFELLESGFHHYTRTPDHSKAYTYGVFKSIANSQVFAVYNTHFWWKNGSEHDAIRMSNAAELVASMEEIHTRYACPVFALGDLNCTKYAEPLRFMAEHNIIRLHSMADAFTKKSSHHGNPVRGSDGLFHGRAPKNSDAKSIDHIVGLCSNSEYAVLNYQLSLEQPLLDASDHSPVYADIVLLPAHRISQ